MEEVSIESEPTSPPDNEINDQSIETPPLQDEPTEYPSEVSLNNSLTTHSQEEDTSTPILEILPPILPKEEEPRDLTPKQLPKEEGGFFSDFFRKTETKLKQVIEEISEPKPDKAMARAAEIMAMVDPGIKSTPAIKKNSPGKNMNSLSDIVNCAKIEKEIEVMETMEKIENLPSSTVNPIGLESPEPRGKVQNEFTLSQDAEKVLRDRIEELESMNRD